MNILIIGSGAREHAFCWKLAHSNQVKKIYVAPGNAGTSQLAENLELDISNFYDLKSKILSCQINLVIVGPELPLIDGIVDFIGLDEDL